MHPLGDDVSPALQNHLAAGREVNADVRAVDLLFDDQRGSAEEAERVALVEMFVVGGPPGAEQVRRAGEFDEVVACGAHDRYR